MRRPAVTGSLLIASAVLSIGGYLVLGTQFGWPAVLDEPGTTALDAFVAAQAWVRFGFYLFLLSSLVLVPAAIGLHDHLDRSSPGSVSVAAFGVLGAFAQMLGWVRWPVTVPSLAQAWTDPAATDSSREATAAAYDVLNGYAGAALGEHLGWLLQGIWAVGIAVLLLRTRRVPRWFAGLGLGLAALWAAAVPTATAVGLETLEFWGLNAYSAWYLWLFALGVLLVRTPRPAVGQPERGGDDSAARSRASSTLQ
jgi:hypothetical protein